MDENTDQSQLINFEDFKQSNGVVFCYASTLSVMLGYPNMKSFSSVINRATKAFISLKISHYDNIIQEKRIIDNEEVHDFKLTRFACYIVVMNGDPKKEEVAKAQAYFAEQTRKFEVITQQSDVDRLIIRDEIVEGNKSLSSTASRCGVTNYAKFQNAGYLGMYNMESWRLEKKRNVKKGKLFDNMGRMELAANLFRITQTEERIKTKKVKGQAMLEKTHNDVGKKIRSIVIGNTGQHPEDLPKSKEIPQLKKELKKGYRHMKKEDK